MARCCHGHSVYCRTLAYLGRNDTGMDQPAPRTGRSGNCTVYRVSGSRNRQARSRKPASVGTITMDYCVSVRPAPRLWLCRCTCRNRPAAKRNAHRFTDLQSGRRGGAADDRGLGDGRISNHPADVGQGFSIRHNRRCLHYRHCLERMVDRANNSGLIAVRGRKFAELLKYLREQFSLQKL